jgi:hypothetical protein
MSLSSRQLHLCCRCSMSTASADRTAAGAVTPTQKLPQSTRRAPQDRVTLTVNDSLTASYQLRGWSEWLPAAAVLRSPVLAHIVQTSGTTSLACSQAGFQDWIEYISLQKSAISPDDAQRWASLLQVRKSAEGAADKCQFCIHSRSLTWSS